MKEQDTNDIARIFLSVIAGVITAIAIGALLIRMVIPLAENYSGEGFPSYTMKDRFMIGLLFFGLFFIASLAGGFVCILISTNREIIQILINSLVSIVVVFVMSGKEILRKEDWFLSLIILLGIPLGNVMGGWIGGRLKRRRKNPVSIS